MTQRGQTPWKKMGSPDIFLSLSNHKFDSQNKSQNKLYKNDRFLIQSSSIRCKLDFQNQTSQQNVSLLIQKSKKKTVKQQNYNLILNQSFGNYKSKNKNIFNNGYLNFYQNFNINEQEPNIVRQFPKNSYKVLNASKLKDDFYTSLLDWGKNDMISVVLDNAVYVWSSGGLEAQKVVQGYISSVKWCSKGMIIGQQTGRVRLLDIQKRKQSARSRNHLGRVGIIDASWSGNQIISGSKDSQIVIWDIRSKDSVQRLRGHQQQICGLKWSWDNNYIASGGNDNLAFIWDPKMGKYIGKITDHTAAIKALAWSPHKSSILATGGGSTDKTIKMWNTVQMNCLNSVDSGSQVCNMTFSTSTNQLVTTHGYSLNSINVWNAKNMQRLTTLEGHTYRVLYLAISPDSQTILTGSGDQTLRFWKLFPSNKSSLQSKSSLQIKHSSLR